MADGSKIDRTKLTPEQRDRLDQYEATENAKEAAEKAAQGLTELQKKMDSFSPQLVVSVPGLIEQIEPIRRGLEDLKKTIQSSDNSAQILKSFQQQSKDILKQLQSLKIEVPKTELKPNISVQSPEVNVSPQVDVDLRGLEKLLKKLPSDFERAIKSFPQTEIPPTDFTPLLDKLDAALERLESIDMGTRLKPQFPNTVKVTNPDGSVVGSSASSGTQYTEGDTDDTITGTAMLWEDSSDTLRTVSSAKPLPVSGTFWQATQPVSGSVTADTELPTAAALSDGASNPTAPAVGAHLMGWNSTTWDRLTTRGSDNDGQGVISAGHIITLGRTQVYNGTTWDRLRGDTTGGLWAQGAIAHDGVDSGKPIKIGGRAASTLSDDTMVANADRSDFVTDVDGTQIVRLNFPLADLLTERTTNTDGASTASGVFTATASTRSVVTAISVYNSSATPGYIDFRDGTAGSVLWTMALPAGGGAVLSDPTGMFRTSANTALAYDVSAALSTVYISVSGFKSKV